MAVLAEHNPEDAYKNDYHGHPKYVLVFAALVFALALSLIPNFLSKTPTWLLIIIFIIAVGKALLVISNFMHIKYEPKLLWGLMAFAVFIFAAFFFGVLPDVNSRLDCSKMVKNEKGVPVCEDIQVMVKDGKYPEYTAYTVIPEDIAPADATMKSVGIVRGNKNILKGKPGRNESGAVFYHK